MLYDLLCDTAEKAEKLVKEFALENGFELGDDDIYAMAPEDLSDEELETAAGGIIQDSKKSFGFVQMIGDPDNRVHFFNNDNGIGIFCKPNGNVKLASPDNGPRDDHENILW